MRDADAVSYRCCYLDFYNLSYEKILPNPPCPKRIQCRACHPRKSSDQSHRPGVNSSPKPVRLAVWLFGSCQETISGVFISPYIRTQQTALPYLQNTGFDATVMPSLQGFNILEFERIFQRELSEIRTMAQAFWQLPNDHKDGDSTDSFDDFVARVRTARHL